MELKPDSYKISIDFEIVELTNGVDQIGKEKYLVCGDKIEVGDLFYWTDGIELGVMKAIPMDEQVGVGEIPIGCIGPTGMKVVCIPKQTYIFMECKTFGDNVRARALELLNL